MQADWGGAAAAEPALGAVGSIVALRSSEAWTVNICGADLPLGTAVLAEVVGTRVVTSANGEQQTFVTAVAIGGPLDNNGGMDSVYSALSPTLMGMCAIGCQDVLHGVPLANLTESPLNLTGEEVALRSRNTLSLRESFLRFRGEMPAARAQKVLAQDAIARLAALEEVARREQELEQSQGAPRGAVAAVVAGVNEAESEGEPFSSIHPSLLPNNTRSHGGGRSEFTSDTQGARKRTAYETDLAAAAQAGELIASRNDNHLKLGTALGASGIVDKDTGLKLCSVATSFAYTSNWQRLIKDAWQIGSGEMEDTLRDGTSLGLMKHTNMLVARLWTRPLANAAAQVVYVYCIHMMAVNVRHSGFAPDGQVIPGIEDGKKSSTTEMYDLLGSTDKPVEGLHPGESELDCLLRQEDVIVRKLFARCVELEANDVKRRKALSDSGGASRGKNGQEKDNSGAVTEAYAQLTALRNRTAQLEAAARGGGQNGNQGHNRNNQRNNDRDRDYRDRDNRNGGRDNRNGDRDHRGGDNRGGDRLRFDKNGRPT